MGSSSSASSNRADWTPDPHCDCGCQHYCAVKMELRAHPMQRWEHHAVLVYFVCGACGKENRHTYDFSSHGKERRWGYYRRSLEICAETKLNVSYEKVEDVFHGMWTGYSLTMANCQHWTRDFYNRVGAESTETFDPYRQRIGFEILLPMTGR